MRDNWIKWVRSQIFVENEKSDFASHCGRFFFRKCDCAWEAQMTAQFSHYRRKQRPGCLQIVHA